MREFSRTTIAASCAGILISSFMTSGCSYRYAMSLFIWSEGTLSAANWLAISAYRPLFSDVAYATPYGLGAEFGLGGGLTVIELDAGVDIIPPDEPVTDNIAPVGGATYVRSLNVAIPPTAAFEVLPDANVPTLGVTVTIFVEVEQKLSQ